MSYTSGVINIPNVTGNIVITATATVATVSSISAVFNQGQNVVYDTDSLDTLKQYLTVTATYADTSTAVVTNYTLSGTLAEGTSTVTVSYGGFTDTFTVTVSSNDTSPVIKSVDMGYGTSGAEAALTGASATVPMSLGQTYEQTSATNNVYIKYFFPKDASVSLTASKCKIIRSLEGSFVGYSSTTFVDPTDESASEQQVGFNRSSGGFDSAAFTLASAHTADSYAYVVDTGYIIFAGRNTKYYGMHYISEASS